MNGFASDSSYEDFINNLPQNIVHALSFTPPRRRRGVVFYQVVDRLTVNKKANFLLVMENPVFPGFADFATYEYLDEYGEIPPHNEELKQQLFGKQAKDMVHQGEFMKRITELPVKIERDNTIKAVKSFADAGLHPVMLENIALCGYSVPTPIQSVCIPAILQGKEVVVCAQTGTGKTAAFLLPIFSLLMGKYKNLAAPRPGLSLAVDQLTRAEPLVLIITPTRELALQIYNQCRRFSYRSMLRPVAVFGGGEKMGPHGQMTQLQRGCDVLIATPGRLLDLLQDPQLLSLRRLKYTVIDEADDVLADDWIEDIDKILFSGDTNLDADHKLLMFSATFSPAAREVAADYMGEDHPIIFVGRLGSTHGNIEHEFIEVQRFEKPDTVYGILSQADNMKRTIIFCNSRMEADRLDDFLFNKGLPVVCSHGGRSQVEREMSLRKFRDGDKAILVTTAMFSRGIDIADVAQIINFDMPSMDHGGVDEFVHRIGRTGRMGNKGRAISLMTDRNADIVPALVDMLQEVGQDVPSFLLEMAAEGGSVGDDGEYAEIAEEMFEGSGENFSAPADEQTSGWGQ